jgi:hypothetical protein
MKHATGFAFEIAAEFALPTAPTPETRAKWKHDCLNLHTK